MWTAWVTRYNEDPTLRFLLRRGPYVLIAFGAAYVVGAIGIGSRWKLAADIFLGSSDASIVHGGYGFALMLALVGYLLVPAFIAAVVSAIIATLAIRRVTEDEARRVVNKALGRGD
jgi:hypothetical protein